MSLARGEVMALLNFHDAASHSATVSRELLAELARAWLAADDVPVGEYEEGGEYRAEVWYRNANGPTLAEGQRVRLVVSAEGAG